MLPGLFLGPSLDASVFSAVGWRLTEGDLLYANVWDHKPPGMYAPYLLSQALTENPAMAWAATWGFTVVSGSLTALIVRLRLRGLGIGWPADAAAVLTALATGSYFLSLGGGLGESFAILPAALAFAVASAGRPVPYRWLVSGMLVGASALISVQAIAVTAAIVVLAGSRGLGEWLRRLTVAAAGGAIEFTLLLASLILSGTATAVGDAMLRYNAAYRAFPRLEGALRSLPWVILALMPLVLPAAMAALTARRVHIAPRLLAACGAWILTTLLLILLQGRLYGHYALPLVVPLGVVAGLGIEGMRRRLPDGRFGSVLLGAPMVAVVLLTLVVGAAAADMEGRVVGESNQKVAAVAPAVDQFAAADELVFVWGNSPRLYEVADRAPASRYIYIYPLLTRGYATDRLIAQLLADFQAQPPTVIVDAGSTAPGEPGMPPLLIDRPVATDGRDLDLLDPLRAFVRERYELAETVAGWPIYVLVDR
jgi:hypothetical protein